MERFLVSARKYRPLRFADVVGQEAVTVTLKNAIRTGKVGHAFLFCGPRGVGKTTCARILARALNCENLTPEAEPCGTCRSCQNFTRSASFNIHELDAASNNSVDDMRSLIEQVRYMPQEGKYKVYIIDEVHMLSQAAFNAFLKTLEEPPPYAIFIMATTEKHKVLPTIISRCQIHDFRRVMIDDMIPFLEDICKKEDITYDRDGLYVIAQKADGALRDALSIFDKAVSFGNGKVDLATVLDSLNVLDSDYYFTVTGSVLAGDIPQLLITYADIVSRGFEGDVFLEGLAQHFRDLLVCKHPDTARLLEVSGKYRQRYADQAAAVDGTLLLGWLQIITQSEIGYRMSRNKRLHVELALMRMAEHATDPKKKEHPPRRDEPAVKTPAKPVPASRADVLRSFDKSKPVTPEIATVDTTVTNGGSKDRFSSSYKKIAETVLKPKAEPATAHVEEARVEFVQADVTAAWGKIVNQVKQDRKVALATTLQRYAPQPVAPGRLRLVTANSRDLEHLQEVKLELVRSLQKELNVSSLELQFELRRNDSTEPVDIKPYTDRDKFEAMAKKNPAILKLKEKLDLDFEY